MARGGFAIAAVLKEEEGLLQRQYGKWRVRHSGGIKKGRVAAVAVWQGEGSP